MYYQRQGNGPVLLLIPGLAATTGFFARAVAVLSREHTVITVDLPGHGKSLMGQGEATLLRTATDLRTIIVNLGLDKVTLVGWSLGATVAWTYLEHFQGERIEGLVSIEQTPYLLAEGSWKHAAFGTLDAAGIGDLLHAVETDSEKFVENLIRSSFAAGTTPDAALLAELVAEAKTCHPAAIRSLLIDVLNQDWRKRVTTITTPTLLINGVKSMIYPTKVGSWLVNAFPVSRLDLFEESGHLCFIEEAEKFCVTVRDFAARERLLSP